MTTANAAWPEQGRTIAALWFAAAGGPIAWALHTSIVYSLAAVLCRPAAHPWLYGVTVVALVVAAAAAYVGWRYFRRVTHDPGIPRAASVRTRYFSTTGMLLAGIAALGILGQTASFVSLQRC